MPSRSFPVGTGSVFSMAGILGTPTQVNLITAGAGLAQNGYRMPTDILVVTNANAGNNAITLPDPYLLGWAPGDFYEIINTSAVAVNIFPPTGGTLNNGAANVSIGLAQGRSLRIWVGATAAGASAFYTP